MIINIKEGGKITLPPEYIEELRLGDGIEVEVSMQNDAIVVKRLRLSCTFCNSIHKLVRMGKLCACRAYIDRLHEAKESNYLYPGMAVTPYNITF
jgi:antitoxin component of MazEF toxin-antitoxin module